MTRLACPAEAPRARRRTIVLGWMLACVALPPLYVLLTAAPYYSATRASGTIVTSAGQTREYMVHVPKTYDAAKPTPLVISMHGAENYPSFQMDLSQWNDLAEEQGFIAVYPAGEGGGPKIWHMRGVEGHSARPPDIVFISELIDTLEATYNIDPSRIYANGLSNGGGMTWALSCTLSNRIAAFGPVAAAVLMPLDWCTDTNSAPAIIFHGTGDRFAPYYGAKVWIAPLPFQSIPAWAASWAQRNRCAPNPVESMVAADVTRLEYTNCVENASVLLYTIKEGGHTWPGGGELPEWLVGRTTRSINATRLMWDFFRAHPLRRRFAQNPTRASG